MVFSDQVAGGDHGVAFEHVQLDAFERGALENACPFVCVPVKHIEQVKPIAQLMASLVAFKHFIQRQVIPLAVMRADLLAHIATSDPVAHHGVQFEGDKRSVFQSQVADAARAVHCVAGRVNACGGAGINAACAGAAVVGRADAAVRHVVRLMGGCGVWLALYFCGGHDGAQQ